MAFPLTPAGDLERLVHILTTAEQETQPERVRPLVYELRNEQTSAEQHVVTLAELSRLSYLHHDLYFIRRSLEDPALDEMFPAWNPLRHRENECKKIEAQYADGMTLKTSERNTLAFIASGRILATDCLPGVLSQDFRRQLEHCLSEPAQDNLAAVFSNIAEIEKLQRDCTVRTFTDMLENQNHSLVIENKRLQSLEDAEGLLGTLLSRLEIRSQVRCMLVPHDGDTAAMQRDKEKNDKGLAETLCDEFRLVVGRAPTREEARTVIKPWLYSFALKFHREKLEKAKHVWDPAQYPTA